MPQRALLLLLLLFASAGSYARQGPGFVENRGQWPGAVTFKVSLPQAEVWVERGAMLMDLYDAAAVSRLHAGHGGAWDPGASRVIKHHALRLRFIGAGGPTASEGLGVQQGAYHYFIGKDPARWASGAHAFAAVEQRGLYPGVDLRFRLQEDLLKYDLVIAPGSDPGQVRFTYEGADGLQLHDGALVVGNALGDMLETVPLAYQLRQGKQERVECRYVLQGGEVSFHLGAYDPDLELVIDPVLRFSTYSGSASDNFGYSATFDDLGFLYAGSSAFGQGYPTTTGAYDVTWNGGTGSLNPGTDIAITKFDTTGSNLIWSTFLGGSGDDLPHSLIVDQSGQLVVLGSTGSADFPVTAGAWQSSFAGGTPFTPQGIGTTYPTGTDMVLSRLSADGDQLLASTYLGGSGNDGINSAPGLKFNYADEMRGEVDLAAGGNVVVASCTQSTDFPVTAGAYDTSFNGGLQDGVVLELDPGLSTLAWSSFIGGSGNDAAYSLAFTGTGGIFIAGGTTSSDLPTTASATEPTYQGGTADAFLAAFSPQGQGLLACTYYGSGAYDQSHFVELDGDGDVYLFGQTMAPQGELIANATYAVPTGGQLLAKLSPDLGTVIWSSRSGALSGPGMGVPNISPTAFLVDQCDKIYISGWGSAVMGTLSTQGLPVTPDAYQGTTDGNDFYLAVFDMDMDALAYATYFGGAQSLEHVDGGTSRFDRRGRVYEAVCAGCGGHDDFPSTPNAWSSTNNSSNCNLGVFKFDFESPLVIAAPVAQGPLCAGSAVQFIDQGNLGAQYLWYFGDGTTSTDAAPQHVYALPGTYTVSLVSNNGATCNASDSASIQVTVLNAAPDLTVMPDTALCGPAANLLLSASAGGQAQQWTWSSDPGFSDMLNTSPADSTALLVPVVAGTYWVRATADGACAATGSVTITTALVNAAISPDRFICADDTAVVSLTGVDAGAVILWSPETWLLAGQGTAQVLTRPPDGTWILAVVTMPSGCIWTDSAQVNVSLMNGAVVDATVDQALVLPGTTVQLQAVPTTGVSWAWSPAAAVSNPGMAAPTAVVNATTTFYVSVSDGTCTAIDSVTVRVHELVCGDPDIFVPDAFTPNGDGSNDALFVRGRHIASMELKVFDRWGETVFDTDDQGSAWDGSYKGKPVDPAVYVYWLTVKCADGQDYFHKGNVTVIR
jgi:gliding motility-associated-like protein